MPRVLIVDDTELDLAVVEDYLRPLQCTVARASEGYEAILAAEREAPDLVLLDVLIPGPDGIRVLREIKASAGEDFVPVVLMTGVSSADYRHAAFDAGADGFLLKPIDPLELLPLARNLLALRDRYRAAVQAREELQRVQAARQVLTNLLVHDLRNPITVIQSNLQFLLRELEGAVDPEWRAAVAESRVATQRLLRMISNLVDTARIADGQYQLQPSDVNVVDLIEAAVQRAGDPGDRTVSVGAVEPSLALRADSGLLARALDNVIDTLLRFSPAGAQVKVEASAAPGGRVRLQILATGAALPEELRRHLLQPFEQVGLHVSPAARHAALALYFCRLAATIHRGQIGVSLEPAGTRVTLVLPSSPPA